MGQELLFLLLPVAAFSGWLLGRNPRHRTDKPSENECPDLSQSYFKGLNYLLNEQPDKALQVFIEISELDRNTIELHFAMANLLSKRGEVDRAIHIHQNLIARPVLTREERSRALFELGRDYMRAGLLDRAETLFEQLRDDPNYGEQSLLQLLEIYQQEKEWDRAIQAARHLKGERQRVRSLRAHFFCELVDEALSRSDITLATKLLKSALAEDRSSIRASLLEAEIQLRKQNAKAAIRSLQRVVQTHSEFLSLTLQPLQRAYEQMGNRRGFSDYLQHLELEQSTTATLLASKQLQQQEGSREGAVALLHAMLRRRPSLRLLQRLLELRQEETSECSEVQLAAQTLETFLANKPLFHCENCGFTSRTMHWQCPGCKQWDRVKPIHGIEGD